MAAFPTTSFETCKVEFPNTHVVFYTIEKRPIFDDSLNYIDPESLNSNVITKWYEDKVIRQYNMEGITKTWYYRPTIQDVYNGRCGSGCCVKFNSNGSIYMNWADGMTWYYGPLIDGVFENAYDAYESDDEPCERCRCWNCYCGYGGRMWD